MIEIFEFWSKVLLVWGIKERVLVG